MFLHICEEAHDPRLWELWGLWKTHGEPYAVRRLLAQLKDDALWSHGWLTLGVYALSMGSLTEARGYIERARDLSPESGIIHAHLAICCVQQGDLDEGRWYAERAVELSPQSRQNRWILGGILMRQGEARLAMRWLLQEQITPKKPSDLASYESEPRSLLA
ncbi:MAG: tetratricopeptide repeat protein [Myxococcales bacterium]|nr:tetratricopeptide repeat protein [Myxococcales bacterium]